MTRTAIRLTIAALAALALVAAFVSGPASARSAKVQNTSLTTQLMSQIESHSAATMARKSKGLATKKNQSKSFGTPTDLPFLNLAQ